MEYVCMINIKDEEKLQMLVDSQSELNYRELTNFLELPYLRGYSKDKQLNELSKICKIEKNKTRYKITEIYDDIIDDNKRKSHFLELTNISKENEHKAGIYKIQLDNDIYIGQTNDFKRRFYQHYYGQNIRYKGFGADTEKLLRNGGSFEVLEFEDNVEQRLLKENYWVQYYSQNGYNILNTEKLLSNKNSRQKRNKPNTKCIKVLAKNYNEAIQLLKDKGLLYET